MEELHHIGYKVKNIEESTVRWERMGAKVESPIYEIKSQHCRTRFLQFGNGRIELVEFNKGNAIPLGIYHSCYLCDDLNLFYGGVVLPRFSSEAFEGRKCCFVYYQDLGLIEWVKK